MMAKKLIFYLLVFDAFFIAGLLLLLGFDWYWSLLGLLPIGFIALASSQIQWNFFLPAVHSVQITENKVALTFDDGPHPVYTPQVLDILKKYNAKAGFFLIGKNVRQNPHLTERIIKEGHTIGNHSFTHSKTIDFKDKKGWLKELEETDSEIQKITGNRPRFFRPPYGVTTPHLGSAIEKSGHLVIGWDVRSFDTTTKNPQALAEKVIKKTKNGSIILLHDRHEMIVPILEQLLPELARKNFTFVAVNDLIDEQPYV